MSTINTHVKFGFTVAAFAVLAACSGGGDAADGAASVSSANADRCVPLSADGTFYVVENGKLRPTTAPEAEVRVVQAPKGWAQTLEGTFAGKGFPWMKMDVKGEVATLVGLAPTQAAKDRGYEEGKAAILADADGGKQVSLVVNGISVEGGEAGVGEAVAALTDRPSLASCQKAFSDTMQGRNVQFRTASATILPASAQLLDAVTGVGLLCRDYSVEIGGHTDKRGSDAYNQDLSDRRAKAVREYLIARGVPADELSAVGYGESVPLDPSDTMAAYAKNRRTEFKVSEK